MSNTTKSQLVEILIAAVPYPAQIKDLNLDAEPDAIRFKWRGNAYRFRPDLGVEEIEGGFLSGSDIAILMEALLKRTYIDLLDTRMK